MFLLILFYETAKIAKHQRRFVASSAFHLLIYFSNG